MIVTARLELRPATLATTRAALDGPAALAAGLGANVPPTWPPEYLDRQSLEFTLERLAAGPEQAGWWLHFVVLVSKDAGGPTLVGSSGYAGPPTAEGTVEIGYAIVSDHRRRGYAAETVRGLVAHAFSRPDVRRVVAETLPELAPSIGVLHKCGFRLGGPGSAPGVQRFELTRIEHEKELR